MALRSSGSPRPYQPECTASNLFHRARPARSRGPASESAAGRHDKLQQADRVANHQERCTSRAPQGQPLFDRGWPSFSFTVGPAPQAAPPPPPPRSPVAPLTAPAAPPSHIRLPRHWAPAASLPSLSPRRGPVRVNPSRSPRTSVRLAYDDHV